MTRPKKSSPATTPSSQIASVSEWLALQAKQDLLRIITCGSMGTGKSTLIARLIGDSQQYSNDQLAAVATNSKDHSIQGTRTDIDLPMNGVAAVGVQDHTIDVAYNFFSTLRRKFIVADAPGQEQHTRNMISGASTADVAVLVIDAQDGVLTQTRRHAYLVSLLGVQKFVLAINKMDLVHFSEGVFNHIQQDFIALAKDLSVDAITAIPLSAVQGDNITTRSGRTPWYQGPTFADYLETVNLKHSESGSFIFPIQWVNRAVADFSGLCGTVASGQLEVGDAVRVTASGHTANVQRIIGVDGDHAVCGPGDAITLVLDRNISASRGDIFSKAAHPMQMTDQFAATLIWMHEDAGLVGRNYELKLASQIACASITNIKHRININNLAHESCRQLGLNDITACNLALSKPVIYDSYAQSKALGGFILIDRFTHATVAMGMVQHNLRRAQNVHRQALSITREEREHLNGHKGKVIWFTGLSGSGKSTIANALEKELHAQGKRTYILDGDNVRQGLNKDLGFTDADRVENIRRVAEVAKLMMDAGLIVMTAFISPFRAEREMARQLIGTENFIEVFVDTPLEVCEARDPKGLYKKARNGQLPNMTGINSPYEPPVQSELVIKTAQLGLAEALSSVTSLLSRER